MSKNARSAFIDIEQKNALGIIPTIVLAELIHLADNKKIPLNIKDTIARIQLETNFVIVPLDLLVIQTMISLKKYEIHDRVIVATARSFEAVLITKDEFIRSTGTIKCVW